jgi:hypothetical protein
MALLPHNIELKWLAEQLERPGFSQAGLAKALGRDSSAVSRILSGDRQIKAVEVPVILAYLGHTKPLPFTEGLDLYFVALGDAVASWSTLEWWLDQLLVSAMNPPHEVAEYLGIILRKVPDYSTRLNMVDGVLAVALEGHRNELDTWHSLHLKIQRAGTRRDEDVSAAIRKSEGAPGGALGDARRSYDAAKRKEYEAISVSRLNDDAAHFRAIVMELIALNKTVANLNATTKK